MKRIVVALLLAGGLANAVSRAAEPAAGAEDVGYEPMLVRNEARPLEKLPPQYPKEAQRAGIEGWVVVSYVVRADGTVADPVIEDSTGVQVLERAALKTVAKWRYEPATLNGRPVEQCHTKLRITFAIDGPKGATRWFGRRYQQAWAALDESDYTTARQLVDELSDRREMNLYELAHAALLKGVLAQRTGDEAAMLQAFQRATMLEGEYLGQETYVRVLRAMFAAEAKRGHYSSALALHARLEAAAGELAADDPLRAPADELGALRSGPQPLGFPGTLADNCACNERAWWAHELLRRQFTFDDLGDGIADFQLRCDYQRVTDQVSRDKVWTVPESWGDCTVFVFGEPGATLKLIEYPLAEPGAAPVEDGST